MPAPSNAICLVSDRYQHSDTDRLDLWLILGMSNGRKAGGNSGVQQSPPQKIFQIG